MSHNPQLAKTIRAQRERLKLSIRDVAKQAEISAAMLSRVETDGVSAGAGTLARLAEVIGLDSDLLLLLGKKLPPDIEWLLFSGDPNPRLKLLKSLRQKLKKL
jgi:transcriptional regulator with XRE-family HTH domain